MDLECCNSSPAFILYGRAEVFYEGRASSTLERGNYLIVKKHDGSLMVHGGVHVPALNYMSSGSQVSVKGNIIAASRKSETIRIVVYACQHLLLLDDWSDNKIQITKTEADLTNKIVQNPATYLGSGNYAVYREHPTVAGPVDLVLVSTDVYIIEVKRRKITLKDCYQLQRYLDAFGKLAVAEKESFKVDQDCEVIGCLAGPAISDNALEYCDTCEIRYLRVLFEGEAP